MRKFQLISDIHLEQRVNIEIKKMADYLILAGDIGYPEQDIFKNFMKINSNKFKKIFYITGNHEYYQNWKQSTKLKINTITETNQIIKNILAECGDNIYFINNDHYDIDEKIRIVGTTLWSNIFSNSLKLSDSFEIYSDDNELITFDYIRKLHNENKEFIKKQIQIAKNENKKLIVCSHHLPSFSLILQEYKEKYPKYVSQFASDLDYLINEPIIVWCAGHSHGFNKLKINNVDCYINAYGYTKQDRNNASLDFTFEIDN